MNNPSESLVNPLIKNHTTRSGFACLTSISFLLIFSLTSCKKETSYFRQDRVEFSVSHGDTIHNVWLEDRDHNCENELYYHRSTDKGKTWNLEKCLSLISPFPQNPSLWVSNTTVKVFWLSTLDNNRAIYFRRSTDAGVTWEPSVRLTSVGALGRESHSDPHVVVSDPLLIAVWKDDRDGYRKAIYFKRSTDGGANWGPDTCLVFSPDWLLDPSLALSGSTVHVTWRDIRDGNWEIYYKCSTDGGSTWGQDTRLTFDPAISISPNITATGTKIRITWEDRRGNEWGKYSKCSTDGGKTWGPDSLIGPGQTGFVL
jgi:hypothetical protein